MGTRIHQPLFRRPKVTAGPNSRHQGRPWQDEPSRPSGLSRTRTHRNLGRVPASLESGAASPRPRRSPGGGGGFESRRTRAELEDGGQESESRLEPRMPPRPACVLSDPGVRAPYPPPPLMSLETAAAGCAGRPSTVMAASAGPGLSVGLLMVSGAGPARPSGWVITAVGAGPGLIASLLIASGPLGCQADWSLSLRSAGRRVRRRTGWGWGGPSGREPGSGPARRRARAGSHDSLRPSPAAPLPAQGGILGHGGRRGRAQLTRTGAAHGGRGPSGAPFH